jgi:hypothetical protein
MRATLIPSIEIRAFNSETIMRVPIVRSLRSRVASCDQQTQHTDTPCAKIIYHESSIAPLSQIRYSLIRLLQRASSHLARAQTTCWERRRLPCRITQHGRHQTGWEPQPSVAFRNATALDAVASANTRRLYNRFAQKEAGSHYTIGPILL